MASAYKIGLAVQIAGADSGIWITKVLCRCDSCPSSAEVKTCPPCGWFDNHWCEAGIKGGNPKLGREPRRVELEMDRNTNPCLTVVILARLTRDDKPAPKGDGCRVRRLPSPTDSTLTSIPADSGVLFPMQNGALEQGNPCEALRCVA